MTYYLAIDIGASSGRHILAWREGGEFQMKEIYRFPNMPKKQGEHLVWDIESLSEEVLRGIAVCSEMGITPKSVGIDTWGVDYVLLDERDAPILPVYCYRDTPRGETSERVHKIIPQDKLYASTGTQYQPFNTVYQLYWDKEAGRLDGARDFLMLPEYLSFLLCGKRAHEYTNASTTGLLDAKKKVWDKGIIEELGLPARLFSQEPVKPATVLGRFTPEVEKRVGFSCDVVLVASHDTASAIAALPNQDGAYISSGTWSLLGAEISEPITTKEAREANFTNEGGVGTIRFLKNIMGMWLIQCLRRETNSQCSFVELAEMAEREAKFDYDLDVNAQRYLAPESVTKEISDECAERGYPIPQTEGEFAHAIYSSLAHAYKVHLEELEAITGKRFDSLCIVGGGSGNKYLNKLTERAIGRPVVKGASEASSLGNIIMQEAAYV